MSGTDGITRDRPPPAIVPPGGGWPRDRRPLGGMVRRRRVARQRPWLLASLLLHALVLAAVLLRIGYEQPPQEVPPSSVAMVFESGQKQRPSAPHPTRESRVPAPSAKAAPPAPRLASPPPTPRPAPAPQPRVAAPAPAPPVARPAPELPKAETPAPLPPPAAKPAPRSVAKAAPQPRKAPAFPAPMNYSFGAPVSLPRQTQSYAASHALNLALGPVVRGDTIMTPYSDSATRALGADWSSELAAWVDAHKFYPEEARSRDEQGPATVRVTVRRDGQVLAVDLTNSSGSSALDTAWLSIWRDARVPPFPSDAAQNQITFNFTMNYILGHGR